MEFVCRRCQHITKQAPYRVTSEEGGAVLINMIVCAPCARLAKWLGLAVVKMKSTKGAAGQKHHPKTGGRQQHVPRRPDERTDCEANSGAVLHAQSRHPHGRRGRAQRP